MRCRMWPHNSLGGFHLRHGRVLIHRTSLWSCETKTPHYVSAVLRCLTTKQALISANILSCTWTQADGQEGKHKDTYLSSNGSLGATRTMLSWRALMRSRKIKHFLHIVRHAPSLSFNLSPPLSTISTFLDVIEVFFLTSLTWRWQAITGGLISSLCAVSGF